MSVFLEGANLRLKYCLANRDDYNLIFIIYNVLVILK